MQVLTLKRMEMVPQIEAAHFAAMVRLRRVYPSPESQAVLDKADKVQVELSERMGTCAGRALMRAERIDGKREYTKFSIRLNARLHAINPDQLIPTYLHELAHIVANLMLGECAGHGHAWKMVMAALGVSDERCHKMDVSAFAKPQKKFTYACVKCDREFQLSKVRHNKAQFKLEQYGIFPYMCPCRGVLEWKDKA